MVAIQESRIESKMVWSGDAALRRDLLLGLARASLPGPIQLPEPWPNVPAPEMCQPHQPRRGRLSRRCRKWKKQVAVLTTEAFQAASVSSADEHGLREQQGSAASSSSCCAKPRFCTFRSDFG